MENLATRFMEGGFFMWPILLCSALGIALAIERYLFLKNSNSVRKDDLLKYIRSSVIKGDLARAIATVSKDNSPLTKIVREGLIKRTIEERNNDIKKGIFKEINSQINKIELESQTSSRIVALVELNYLETIRKNSGELVSETSLTPLKVKYILGFSNKSWKLVDFISGL